MPTFLILQSPNKGNIGTTQDREEGFYKPTFYQISEQELAEFTAMSQHAKNAFIAEKLEAQMGTPEQVKKKIVPIVEVVESQDVKESVEIPQELKESLEAGETLTDKEYNDIKEEYKPVVDEMINNAVEEIAKPKAKGRPKKVN